VLRLWWRRGEREVARGLWNCRVRSFGWIVEGQSCGM